MESLLEMLIYGRDATNKNNVIKAENAKLLYVFSIASEIHTHTDCLYRNTIEKISHQSYFHEKNPKCDFVCFKIYVPYFEKV